MRYGIEREAVVLAEEHRYDFLSWDRVKGGGVDAYRVELPLGCRRSDHG